MKTKCDTFEVQKAIVVSDPCYALHDGEKSTPAKKGEWTARATVEDCGGWGKRVVNILVHHVDFSPVGKRYDESTFYRDVDSGQMGVFDTNYYGGIGFYDECCGASNPYGFVEGGFVSSSGYGDGSYLCRVFKEAGKAVGVEVVFIPEGIR